MRFLFNPDGLLDGEATSIVGICYPTMQVLYAKKPSVGFNRYHWHGGTYEVGKCSLLRRDRRGQLVNTHLLVGVQSGSGEAVSDRRYAHEVDEAGFDLGLLHGDALHEVRCTWPAALGFVSVGDHHHEITVHARPSKYLRISSMQITKFALDHLCNRLALRLWCCEEAMRDARRPSLLNVRPAGAWLGGAVHACREDRTLLMGGE
jgi:hypothetical protein